MQLKTDEVFSFKLNSGEELIGKVKEFNDSYVIVEEPVSVAPGPQGMGLVPSLFTSENHGLVRLNTNSIAMIANTEENVKMKYIQATTGLAVPSKKIILG